MHLTYTGQDAGQTLCGMPREQAKLEGVSHASLTPSSLYPRVCKQCLATWLVFGYVDEWEQFPTTIEAVAKLEKEIPQQFATDEEVARFRSWFKKQTK